MSEELKPCPFCGGKAIIVQRLKDIGINKYFVKCENICREGCIQKAKDNMLPLASIEAEAMYVAYNSLIKYIDDIIEDD